MYHPQRFVFVLVFALVLAALVRPVQALPIDSSPDIATVDRYVEEQLRTLGIPGAALGIIHGDKIVHLQGFGRADGTGRAMTAQTPSLIGSLTKSFTAVAIMQLVEAGKVELDAPVQRYLPWFRVANAEASAQITLRHLLTHSSGLPDSAGTDALFRMDTGADALERQVRTLAAVELTQPVGSTWQYANANYSILGLIIETVSGQSYEAYVRQQIFAPLQMEHSFTSPIEARSAGLAAGHQYWFGQPRPTQLPYPRGLLPAGFLVSSAEDMSRYLIAHLNGGQLGEAQILSPEGVAELHRPAISAGDPSTWIGMGWGVIDADGVHVLHHDGNTGNTHSEMFLLPETGWGFVLLMNASNGIQKSAIGGIGRGVATLLMGQEPQPVALNSSGQIVYSALMLIAALELFGIAGGVRTLRRWRAVSPQPAIWRQVVFPLAGHVLVGLLFLVAVPMFLLRTSLASIVFSVPDLGYTLLIVGALALGWTVLRTVLALRLLPRRVTRSSRVAGVHA